MNFYNFAVHLLKLAGAKVENVIKVERVEEFEIFNSKYFRHSSHFRHSCILNVILTSSYGYSFKIRTGQDRRQVV
jgi:hypothetical protein